MYCRSLSPPIDIPEHYELETVLMLAPTVAYSKGSLTA